MELLTLAALMPSDKHAIANAKTQLLDIAKQFNTLKGLDQACQQLVGLRAWTPAVELVVACVKLPMLKPALSHFKHHQPLDDTVGKQALQQCQQCHELLFGALNGVLTKLYQAMNSAPLGSDAAKTLRAALDQQIYHVLLADDELLDYALFQWLLRHGEDARLIQAESPRVAPYLQERRQQLQGADLQAARACLHLLMRHYQHRKEFAKVRVQCDVSYAGESLTRLLLG